MLVHNLYLKTKTKTSQKSKTKQNKKQTNKQKHGVLNHMTNCIQINSELELQVKFLSIFSKVSQPAIFLFYLLMIIAPNVVGQMFTYFDLRKTFWDDSVGL